MLSIRQSTKAIAFIAAVALPQAGCGSAPAGKQPTPTTLLDYTFGNQIYGSTLSVGADGKVSVTERTCCPPTTTPSEFQLSAAELATIKGEVVQVSQGTSTTHDGTVTTLGSTSGALQVYVVDGDPIIVKSVARNKVGANDIVTINTAPIAAEVLAWVNQHVQTQMPASE